MNGRRIDTAEEAIRFLQSVDVDVITTDGGWIVHGGDADGQGSELTCDSEGELVQYARLLCSLSVRA